VSAPLVSILIPCHNAEKFIGETLHSVARQTWQQIEVIVVDDGSQDGSSSVVERFSGVKLIRQKNLGAGAARNHAYKASTGTYIQFLDADDLIEPDKIERQVVRLMHNPTCVASSEWGRFYKLPKETRFDPEPVWCDLDPLDWLAASRADGLGMMFPALWLIPRAIANAAGPWDESLTLGDDGEYFTRILLASERVLFCPGARCHYRSGISGSLSGRKSLEAWSSAYRVLELCEAHVFACENSERMQRAFSLSWQHLAHAAYPYDPVLAERALSRAHVLHRVCIVPEGGPRFRWLSRIFGWRAARRIQVVVGGQWRRRGAL
jgi:glycosyltransferase involved in cell wall biosynthesis